MSNSPRQCYWICASQRFNPQLRTQGYVPSIVTENESGHSPLMGRGRGASPWYWGMTYDEACKTAAEANKETFGLSEEQAAEIVTSSMGASNQRRFAEDKL